MNSRPRWLNLTGMSDRPSLIQEGVARFFEESLRLAQSKEDRPGRRKAAETAARIFEAIDQLQTINRGAFTENRTLYLPFPLFWGNPADRGELNLELPPEESRRASERPIRISLLLAMTGLGRVKVDVELKGRSIRGTFRTESTATRDRLDRFLSRLTLSLESRGFRIEHLAFQVFEPDRPIPETLLTDLAPRDRGLISIRV